MSHNPNEVNFSYGAFWVLCMLLYCASMIFFEGYYKGKAREADRVQQVKEIQR